MGQLHVSIETLPKSNGLNPVFLVSMTVRLTLSELAKVVNVPDLGLQEITCDVIATLLIVIPSHGTKM
jgi:hypothetical protein